MSNGPDQDPSLTAAVELAIARPDTLEAVGQLYAELAAEIDRRRPLCSASGRCCRFEDYGHRMFVTTLELARFKADLIASNSPLNVIRWDGTGCPFQIDKRCSVHPLRPLGCRMYFCDPTSTEWQNDLYERLHGELRRLHAQADVPYRYVEWRHALIELGLAKPEPAQTAWAGRLRVLREE